MYWSHRISQVYMRKKSFQQTEKYCDISVTVFHYLIEGLFLWYLTAIFYDDSALTSNILVTDFSLSWVSCKEKFSASSRNFEFETKPTDVIHRAQMTQLGQFLKFHVHIHLPEDGTDKNGGHRKKIDQACFVNFLPPANRQLIADIAFSFKFGNQRPWRNCDFFKME